MKAPADKSPDTQRQAAAHEAPQQQSNAEAEHEFVDNREETASLQQLQEAADNSPRRQGHAQLRAMMDNSPRSVEMRNLQAMIHNSPRQVAQRQLHNGIQGATMGLQAGSDNEMTVQRVEDDELLQGEFAAESPVQLAQPPDDKPNNTGLPDNLKAGVESLSGLSLDNVKVHYNSPQPAQLNAHAYAQGTDIHVGPGQEQHLPHEAWHVVQQAQGRVKPTVQMKDGVEVNDDQGLEAEADLMGGKAMFAGVAQAKLESRSSIESDPIDTIDIEHEAEAVQRKIGYEVEVNVPLSHKVQGDNTDSIEKEEDKETFVEQIKADQGKKSTARRVYSHEHVFVGEGFRITADNSKKAYGRANTELVTDPPLEITLNHDTEEKENKAIEEHLKVMQTFAVEMASQAVKKRTSIGAAYVYGLPSDEQWNSLSEGDKKVTGLDLETGRKEINTHAYVQVNVGLSLADIPAMVEQGMADDLYQIPSNSKKVTKNDEGFKPFTEAGTVIDECLSNMKGIKNEVKLKPRERLTLEGLVLILGNNIRVGQNFQSDNLMKNMWQAAPKTDLLFWLYDETVKLGEKGPLHKAVIGEEMQLFNFLRTALCKTLGVEEDGTLIPYYKEKEFGLKELEFLNMYTIGDYLSDILTGASKYDKLATVAFTIQARPKEKIEKKISLIDPESVKVGSEGEAEILGVVELRQGIHWPSGNKWQTEGIKFLKTIRDIQRKKYDKG